MDDTTKLHGTSVEGVEAAPASRLIRQPWHTPAIDVVPLKSAQAGLGSTPDGNGPGTQVC